MDFIDFLQQSPIAFVTCVTILGLLVGSFLNVVIYRLPIMMEQEWQIQCNELNGVENVDSAPLSLSMPRSACPHCQHAISAMENIPILSYLFLAGKCRGCQAAISIRYPIIEALAGLLSGLVAYHFGFDWTCLGALLLTWTLLALTFIDVDHQLLPDYLTLPLLWLGISFNLYGQFTTLEASVIGALAGYLSLWTIYQIFKLVTGKEGMGFGDFKLLAALGAWLGWSMLPSIIFLSSLVGAVVGISLMVFRHHQSDIPIPFGPYLAAAGWISLIWGEPIKMAYLNWAGLA
jgi:leader peptidase (prepilin peptidase)/N-methyltransferase